MLILQTMQDYLDNPMGKGSTAIANRSVIKKDLDERYTKLLSNKKDFDVDVYRIKDIDGYFFHVKVPSESKRMNTYDVVLHLFPEDKDKTIINDSSIRRYVMNVFSNCPSFVYTYAYVYNTFDQSISFLNSKYDPKVINDNPYIKNPGEIINFDKSIYFACKYILEHRIYTVKLTLEPKVKTVTAVELAEGIRTDSVIMAEIDKENIRIGLVKKKTRDDIANGRKRKDYSNETNLEKLKVTGTDHMIDPKSPITPIKKVSYYRRRKIIKPTKVKQARKPTN